MAGKSGIAADWSRLPLDLIEKIAGTLDEDIADRVRFGAVCKDWQSAVKPASNLPRVRLPLLCLQDHDEDSETHEELYRSDFFSLDPEKFYDLLSTRGQIIAWSSHGWILTVDSGKTAWLLLNPVTKAQILLPPMPPPDRGEVYRSEIIVTPDSLAVVMVGFNDGPILCHRRPLNPKGGENTEDSWTEIFCPRANDVQLPTLGFNGTIGNLFTYHKDRFFIFDAKGGETSIVDPDTRQVVPLIPPMPGTDMLFPTNDVGDQEFRSRYLIRSSSGDELYLLISPSRTAKELFEVFVLDMSNRHHAKWSKVRDIGDEVLFVDGDGALATLAPRDSNICRRNCIVFLGACVPSDFKEFTPFCSWDEVNLGLFGIGNDSVEELMRTNLEYAPDHQRWFLPSLS